MGFAVAVGFQLFTGRDGSLWRVSATAAPQQSAPVLLQSQNLVYQGAFRIPQGSPVDDPHSANWGGGCMTYNPGGNGGQGSLLVCGMETTWLVGEISIPTPVNSSNFGALPTASLVNNFVNVLGGHATDIYPEGGTSVALGGLLLYNGKLIVTAYGTFDTFAWNHPTSHFIASADLTHPAYIGGPYQLGTTANPGFVAGFMTPIPPDYQAALGGPYLAGQCCLNIIGRTSSGPSATVFNPDDIGRTNPAPAKRVLAYPTTHPTLGDWYGNPSPVGITLYNGASRMADGVFPEGSKSVLYFGRVGVGKFCYGQATSDPSLIGTNYEAGVPYCYDPTSGSKGSTAYPYKFMVAAYNADDLVAVKNGTKQEWEIVPYSTWELTFPIMFPAGASAHVNIGSVAYDPGNQRIFVSQKYTDGGGGTLINVFKVLGTAPSAGLCR